ncbi:hypothetical protein SpCBS45565_g03666 [Spizellomyces sp. 'palustris']|nr:hypothetical protein SpCBS45565_g03666 [Spizellomyces sp. 'palustris']
MSALSAIAQAKELAAANSEKDKNTPARSADSNSPKTTDKRKRRGKRKKAVAIPKDMVLNAKGELVSGREFALEQTLEATSKSLTQYRDRMDGLVSTNETLQEICQQQEKDALEVIAALHRENEKREGQIKDLRGQIEAEIEKAHEDRENLVDEYEQRISEMNVLLTEKEAAFNVMQQEFSVIKDFRKKRHELLKELEEQKLQLADTERRHKDTVARMERKFFEEKIRLQKEANRKISELATKAHKEAVANLKETTKEVFRQNIRMAEALRYHVQEGEDLGKTNSRLSNVNKQLLEEKDFHDVIVKEKILQTKQQTKEVIPPALFLAHVTIIREFEHEREMIRNLARNELDEVRRVAGKLKESLDRKTLEMRHIKRLAQHILDQRTDLERFFMDALEHVRAEIRRDRDAARKAAQAEYNRRLKAILTSKAVTSPIQSSRPVPNTSVVMPAQIPMPMGGPPSISEKDEASGSSPLDPNVKVDISDLSWVDKEKVLRLLFARMNGISLVGKGGGEYADTEDSAQMPPSKIDSDAEFYALRSTFEGREVDIDDD